MAEAFFTGLGANVVSEFLKSISGTFKQQVLYVFKHRSYINDLNDQVQQLNQKRERVEVGVDRARRQGDEIYEDVGKWLKDVERFIEQEANPITGNEGQAGTCSFITRYMVGRKAVKAAKTGSNLLGKDFSHDVSYRPVLQRTESMYVDRDYEAFDTRESTLLKIMEALKNPNVNRIGVYGMGGVGKTTLVKKAAWQSKEDKLFDDVVMAEVTDKPNYKRIQEKIAHDLGLEFGQHESEFERADRIRNKLKEGKRVLVILDNIWAKPDLRAIGILLGNECDEGIYDNQRLYKILVTSRRQDVLCNDMNIRKNFCVETLSDEDARTLFWKNVGNSTKNNGFCTVAEEIVGKCGGLPLAVATIANALKNKNICAWKDALCKVNASNLRGIPKMEKNVFSIIELSFYLLDSDEAKSLFLLIGLLPADCGTHHDDLLRYSMGLGLFQGVYTLEQGRNRLDTLLIDLKVSCLLLEGDSNSWVKMHEIIHDVAVSIASTNKLMFNIPDVPDLNKVLQEKISKSPRAICLPFRDIDELPERLECPKLELLLLFKKSQSLTIPNPFFEGLKELKVIDFTSINLLLVPSSFGYLMNLRTLCLEECLLGDISIIGKLTTLEILSLSRSNIEQLPREIGQLTRLQLLNLSECSSLKAIPANVISRLSRLEELDLENSFDEWEGRLNSRDGCNANLAELNQLSHLTTLRICIPDAQIIPPSLFIQQLKRFKILIGVVWNCSHSIEASKTLKLKLNNISYLGYKLIKRLLKVTEDLFLDELNGVQNVLYELDEEGFQNLKYLHVENGPELLYIVNSVGQTPSDAFLMLETLSLNNLVNLVKIYRGPLQEASFNKLKAVKVNKCDELKHLFAISMAKCLSQLQKIEVTDCKNLQVIFADEDDKGHLHDESETNNKIAFTQLQSLTLKFLPKFTSFGFNMKTTLVSQTEIIAEDDAQDFKTLFGKQIEFPNLEELILSSVNIEKISSVNTSCHTLKRLVVQGCSGLKFLFSSSVVKSLMQLQYLKISKCELMEEVIDSKGLEGEATISFPKLLSLWLEDLPKFTRFVIGNLVEFPSMIILPIIKCPNLRAFFSNSTSEITSNKPEEMNSEQNIQPLFSEKVGLPSLEILSIFQMDNLRKIWDDQLRSDSFCNLHTLLLASCNKLLNIFPSSILGSLHTLEILKVADCDSLEEIFEFQALNDQKPLAIGTTQLRELHFRNLPKLKHVWNMNAQQILGFENLIKIRVSSCYGLKSLFPVSIAKGLLKLEELVIDACDMNEIVAKEERTIEEATIPRFKFPRLSSLELSTMPFLGSFYSKEHISEWPVLKKMKVCDCSNIKILSSELHSHQEGESQLDHLQALFFVDKVAFPNLEELEVSSMDKLLHLWVGNSQPSRLFQNLENLKVSKCQSLKNLLPSTVSLCDLQNLEVSECDKLLNLMTLSTVRSLVNVKRMDIADCRMIKEIITQEGDEAINDDDQIEFNQLNYLRLHALPSLTSLTNMEDSYENFKTLFGNRVSVPNLEKLEVCKMDTLRKIWDDQLTLNSFCKLKDLTVKDCCEFSNIFPSIMLGRLQTLCSFLVSNCESLEEIFEAQVLGFERTEATGVGQLREIHLSKLPKLKHVWNLDAQGILSFEKLLSVKVENCDNLKNLFPASIAKGLIQLKELQIKSCMVEEIVAEEEAVVAEKEQIRKRLFPKLDDLILEDLPKLKRFCYFIGDLVELFSLANLEIDNCPNMETFISNSICAGMIRNEPEEINSEDNLQTDTVPLFDERVSLPNLETLVIRKMSNLRKIWDDERLNLDSFSKLREMTVGYCNQLLYIFPSIMPGKRQRLELLKVYNCDSLEDIIELQALGGWDEIVFNELECLWLARLPRLRGFYLGNCTLKFPSLDNVFVGKCSKMETFSQGIVNSPKLQGVKTYKEEEEETEREEEGKNGECEWCWEGDLNTTIQHVFKKVNAQTSEQD